MNRHEAIVAEFAAAAARSHAETSARRERVLRYPDLAQRLTEPPLCLSHPARWNGWVPPRTVTGRDGEIANTSPFRRQLVEIAAEALQRERAQNENIDTEETTGDREELALAVGDAQ